MKTTLFTFFLGAFSITLYGQDNISKAFTFPDTSDTDEIKQNDVDSSNFESIEFVEAEEKPIKINGAALNVLFNKQVSRYLTSSGDFTYSKVYAFLDNEDNRMFLGGTILSNPNENGYVWGVFQTGVKLNTKNGFANIRSNDGYASEIGLNFKGTLISKGKISTYKTHRASIKRYDDKLYEKIKNKTFENDDEKKEAMLDYHQKVADYIIENGQYKATHKFWTSMEFYIPVSSSKLLFIDSLSQVTPQTKNYWPWKIKATGTYSYINKKYGAFNVSVYYSAEETNSQAIKDLTKVSFVQSGNRGGYDSLNYTKVTEEEVYLGDFEVFTLHKTGARGVYFLPFKGWQWLGCNLGLDMYLAGNGSYNGINYFGGLSFSFKDKEDDPKVNFDLIYKYEYDADYFGVNIGLIIADIKY